MRLAEEGEQAHSPEAAGPPLALGRVKEACPPVSASLSGKLGHLLSLQALLATTVEALGRSPEIG